MSGVSFPLTQTHSALKPNWARIQLKGFAIIFLQFDINSHSNGVNAADIPGGPLMPQTY